MPYIKQEDREHFKRALAEAKWELGSQKTPGDLNFFITSIIHNYIEFHGTSYKTFNEVIGVLECAKLELYRKKIAPYEEIKIGENGDV